MTRNVWIGVAVLVIGLFMLVAGIGPLLLPIVIVVAGVVLIVLAKRRARQI